MTPLLAEVTMVCINLAPEPHWELVLTPFSLHGVIVPFQPD